MKEINEVKKDLRELKKYSHAIKQIELSQKMHLSRIKLLESVGGEKAHMLIEKEKRLLSSLDCVGVIENASAIEEKYMAAVNALPLFEKGIIIDAFINGTPYWKIGLAVGYSEEGVRKKISKIISKIAQLVYA